MSFTRLGTCTLNQFAMDFEHNMNNILQSIKICKENQVLYRTGPELEISGYMCEDHFLELDTIQHCWEVLSQILPETQGIICDIGMPVIHKKALYNCRVICFNKQIHLIRPKIYLANEGYYRESSWFTPWSKDIEAYELPQIIQKINNQLTTIIGVAIIKTKDTEIGLEICQELWVPEPTSVEQALDGAEIIVNSSGSSFQCDKTSFRTDFIKNLTKRIGACYLFSNMKGCDGNRIYFDGISIIAFNGKIFSTTQPFSLHDVEVTTCDIDLEEVRVHNINFKSRSLQASKQKHFPRVKIPINLTQQYDYAYYKDIPINYPYEMEEATACFLWDYLRRSGASGFMLPLSGGLDSCASAISVYHMCHKVFTTINTKDSYQTHQKVLDTLRRIVSDPEFVPKSPQDIMSRIFFTVYLGTENSSQDTRRRSAELSKALGTTHFEVDIDEICASFSKAIKPVLKQEPKFSVFGGSQAEDLALQNIQARTRMVMTYFMAQLAPWNNGKQGFLLVLGSSNLDESLFGNNAKYGCTSADINPIGSFTSNDVIRFIGNAFKLYGFEVLQSYLSIKDNSINKEEIGFCRDELEVFWKLRKTFKQGPVSMFQKLKQLWRDLSCQQVGDKVKNFFKVYSINRHKNAIQCVYFHRLDHGNDDNRFDQRQIIYNNSWPWQFRKIEEYIKQNND